MEYTPSEKLEAQDKRDAHEHNERGRNEAMFYRLFLENLKTSVGKELK